MKRIAAFAAASAALAAPAFAGGPVAVVEEPVIVAPAPVVAAPVLGAWEGFYAGASLGYGDFSADDTANVADGNGAIYGIQGGYRWDLGQTVLGVELAHAGTGIEDKDADAELKQKTDLKFQVGYDMGQSLVYATAGSSWAKGEIAGESYSDNGWTAGLGYDYDLGNNWVVGAEYLYSKFDNFDNTGVDLDGSTIALRANYKF